MLKALNLDGWNETAWCVPSAVAMVTGASVLHMHSRAAFMQNKSMKDVKGVMLDEAVLLLRGQGYGISRIDLVERYVDTPPTIRRFLKDRTPYEKCMPVMFSTVDHIMCAQYDFAGDNWTKKPVPIDEFPQLQRKVVDAWVVVKNNG